MPSLSKRLLSLLTFYTTSLLSPCVLADLRSVLNHGSSPASLSKFQYTIFTFGNIKLKENFITFSHGTTRYQKITKLGNLSGWGIDCQTTLFLKIQKYSNMNS